MLIIVSFLRRPPVRPVALVDVQVEGVVVVVDAAAAADVVEAGAAVEEGAVAVVEEVAEEAKHFNCSLPASTECYEFAFHVPPFS